MEPKPKARILIVDDDASNARLLAQLFEDTYEVLSTTDSSQALELARDQHPELILLDVMMPGIDGFEVCSRLKADDETSGIPVIFITGMGDFGAETRGLTLGAVDYVTKPISAPVVKMRVRNQIELKRARDQLTRLAITDGLTGLANRRHFDEVLEQEYARLARREGELSLIMLDVDHFKLFNDTYGHAPGDDCLRAIAQTISAAMLRPADIGARYGGEEFACALPETGFEGATAIAEEIRTKVEALRIPHSSSASADHVTVSIGIATVHCLPDGSPHELVIQADQQMYRAKMGGRNRVCSEHFREH